MAPDKGMGGQDIQDIPFLSWNYSYVFHVQNDNKYALFLNQQNVLYWILKIDRPFFLNSTPIQFSIAPVKLCAFELGQQIVGDIEFADTSVFVADETS